MRKSSKAGLLDLANKEKKKRRKFLRLNNWQNLKVEENLLQKYNLKQNRSYNCEAEKN